MFRSIVLLSVTSALVLASSRPADALVIAGPIQPGKIALGYGWPEAEALTEILKLQPTVGGHYIDAPTWWDGHYAATHLYRGKTADLQRLIDALDKLKLPGTKVFVDNGEGFDGPNHFYGTNETLCYDWQLTLSETRNRGGRHKLLPGMNERQILLVVHLGTRLDRNQLKVPEWMTLKVVVDSGAAPPPTVEFGPADALHALARAARDD